MKKIGKSLMIWSAILWIAELILAISLRNNEVSSVAEVLFAIFYRVLPLIFIVGLIIWIKDRLKK